MRLLLDTCVLLWWFAEPEKIPRRIRIVLEEPDNDLFASHVSFIEISVKYNTGKLELPKVPSIFVPEMLNAHGIDSQPLDAEIIYRLENLPRHHRDPFDRLLVCHALEKGLTLVTDDRLLRPYEVPILWD